MDEHHIKEGVEFAHIHRATLQRASLQYGVLEEYIPAILAVESKFGGNVLELAVDFNMDDSRNLWDPEDAIGSIAN